MIFDYWDPDFDPNYGWMVDERMYLNPPPGANWPGTRSGQPGEVVIQVPDVGFTLPGGINVRIPGGVLKPGGGGAARDLAVRITNQYETYLKQNLSAYRSGQISAEQARNNFNQLWESYTSQLGAAGTEEASRAIADRQRGGKFDWFAAYLNPITGGGMRDVIGLPPVGGGVIDWVRSNLLWVLLIVGAIVVFRGK